MREIGLLELCKFLVYVLLVVMLAGKFVTGEWFWGGEADVRRTLWRLWPAEQRLFSENLLAEFDGRDLHKPLYIAVRFVFTRARVVMSFFLSLSLLSSDYN